jgi:CRISPR-associated endonuclease/helicase Cas3
VCRSLLHDKPANPLERSLFERYFKQLYYECDLDAKGIRKLLAMDKELAVSFRTAAQEFQLIDDADMAVVVVRYADRIEAIEKLLSSLASVGPKRQLMRQLQRFTVTINQRVANTMLEQGSLNLIPAVPGMYVQVDVDGLYDDVRGLHIQDIPFNPSMVV